MSGETEGDIGSALVVGDVTARPSALVPAAAADGPASAEPPAGVTYALLKQSHPTYDADYWCECRALYEGGKTLLRNDVVMAKLFPRHRDELQAVYIERRLRAFYVPYAAEIIDHLVAGVTSDPINMEIGGEGKQGGALPDFYQEFVEDVSPDGGAKSPLNELLADQLRTALQTCWAWTLVELPKPIKSVEVGATLADQERAGDLRAYAVAIAPESVIDWEEDDAGDLAWAIVHVVEQRRTTLLDSRAKIVERWTYYTKDSWAIYEKERDLDKEIQPREIIPRVDQGAHSFGRVPLVRLALPRGLWAMNKMHSIAVEHLNKRAALGWGELQSLLPELYEGHGPEVSTKGSVIGEAQQDPGRGVNQRRGQGFVQIRGADDWAKFVGPDTAPFAEARNSCDSLRDDLHRVMHQMALSAANNAAALKRSAESKEQDRASVEVVLQELGRAGRKHAEAILAMVSRGRREEAVADEWTAKGMSEFDSIAVSDSLANALDIDMLRIESPTFRKRHRMLIARQVLEGHVKPDDLEQIEKELEENITDESVAPAAPPSPDGNPPDEEMPPKDGAALAARRAKAAGGKAA